MSKPCWPSVAAPEATPVGSNDPWTECGRRSETPFEPKNIDLDELVRETVQFLSALAVGREVKLSSLISPVVLPIVGDRIQLQQVILNLVVNAIDAMADTPGDDRAISIRTSRRASDIGSWSGADCADDCGSPRWSDIRQLRARTGCSVPNQVTAFPPSSSWLAFGPAGCGDRSRNCTGVRYRRGTFGSLIALSWLATPGLTAPARSP